MFRSPSCRRLIARTVFAVFGWIPIVLLILCAFFVHSKTYFQWSESELANALEMQVNFESFERPRWDTSRFQNVTLGDPETGDDILKCSLMEVEHQHTGTPIPLLRVRLHDCNVYTENSQALWTFIERSFAHRRIWKNMQVEFSATNVTFNNCENQTIQFMSGTLNDVEAGAEGVFAIYIEEKSSSNGTNNQRDPVKLKIVRQKSTTPPTTVITMDTTSCPMSTQLLSYWCEPLKKMGNKARFQGSFIASRSTGSWNSSIIGTINNIELNELFNQGEQTKSQCSALATLTIYRGDFIDQRPTTVQGRVDALNGTIDRNLMDRLVSQWHLAGAGAFNPYSEATPFQQLALGFNIKNEFITFTGKCNNCPAGTILNGTLPLIREPINTGEYMPVPIVLKAFNPPVDNSPQFQTANGGATTSSTIER